jgi:hypothetical protein
VVVVRVIEHPFSDLLREPKTVVKGLAEGDVLLRRRGAPALRLTRVDRDDQRADAYAMVGRALRNLAVHSPAALGEALLDEFPWTSFLPPSDREAFIDDFTRTVVAAAELDSFGPLAQLVEEWRATAEIHADPRVARRLRRPITTKAKPVPRPAS